MNEFELIEQFFSKRSRPRPDTPLGIGDDAAIVEPAAGERIAVAIDTLVAGVHFSSTLAADAIGYRALAVNLSDLAAMGATPRWALLALTLSDADRDWLESFSAGFFELAEAHDVALIGGDTTRGPCAITVTVMGSIRDGQALTRAGALAGDDIYVTGTLGDAALALQLETRTGAAADWIRQRYARPTPRIAAGQALRGIAHGAIDVSDGLLADLGHVLRASGVGARIDGRTLPLSPAATGLFEREHAFVVAAQGGDDYELLFTAAPDAAPEIQRRMAAIGCQLTCIGQVQTEPGLRITGLDGKPARFARQGYRHFD